MKLETLQKGETKYDLLCMTIIFLEVSTHCSWL